MIRRDNNGGWILITQHDHALLSGRIMSHWGNDIFVRPDPYDEVLFAINEHDSGWKEWDSSPKINTENGFPANFTEMSPHDQAVIWSKCYRSHSTDHPYASAITALHFSKFNNSNLNKDPLNEQLKLLQLEMRDFISRKLNLSISSANPDIFPEEIKVNLKLLQIGDIISLTLCHGWRSIEITEAPIDYSGTQTTLKMNSEDGFNYKMSPYPFSKQLLRLSISGNNLDRKTFHNNQELRGAVRNSKEESLAFTITKG